MTHSLLLATSFELGPTFATLFSRQDPLACTNAVEKCLLIWLIIWLLSFLMFETHSVPWLKQENPPAYEGHLSLQRKLPVTLSMSTTWIQTQVAYWPQHILWDIPWIKTFSVLQVRLQIPKWYFLNLKCVRYLWVQWYPWKSRIQSFHRLFHISLHNWHQWVKMHEM